MEFPDINNDMEGVHTSQFIKFFFSSNSSAFWIRSLCVMLRNAKRLMIYFVSRYRTLEHCNTQKILVMTLMHQNYIQSQRFFISYVCKMNLKIKSLVKCIKKATNAGLT